MNFQQIRDFVNPAVGQATGIEPVETLAMPVPAAHMMQQPGGGGSITVDSELSETSTNPVENRVITAALNKVYAERNFPIIVTASESGMSIDKTFSEAVSAYNSGKVLVLYVDIINGNKTNTTKYDLAGVETVDDEITTLAFAPPLLLEFNGERVSGMGVRFTADGIQAPAQYRIDVTPDT